MTHRILVIDDDGGRIKPGVFVLFVHDNLLGTEIRIHGHHVSIDL